MADATPENDGLRDEEALDAGWVEIPAGDIAMPAYRAVPRRPGPHPVVVVVSEIFGVHEHIADVTRRFARLGYLAIAPELFVRQGDAKAALDIDTLIATVVAKVPDAQALGDLDATFAWALGHGGDAARLGLTGFCWGGRMTWLYAARKMSPGASLKAAVAWYGKVAAAVTPLQPRQPVDLADALCAPVLGLYAGKDTGIPLEGLERMRAALASGSAEARASTIVVYPDAQHAFHADYRPSYDAEAAADGWRRCLGWLRDHGVA